MAASGDYCDRPVEGTVRSTLQSSLCGVCRELNCQEEDSSPEVPASVFGRGAKKQLPHRNISVIDTFFVVLINCCCCCLPQVILDGDHFRRQRGGSIIVTYLVVLNYIHRFLDTLLFKRWHWVHIEYGLNLITCFQWREYGGSDGMSLPMITKGL